MPLPATSPKPTPGLVERDASRYLRQRPRPIQRAVSEVAPVAEPGRAGVQNVGQTVAEQVDQRHARGVQAQCRQVVAAAVSDW